MHHEKWGLVQPPLSWGVYRWVGDPLHGIWANGPRIVLGGNFYSLFLAVFALTVFLKVVLWHMVVVTMVF